MVLKTLKRFTPGSIITIIFIVSVLVFISEYKNDYFPHFFDGYPQPAYKLLSKSIVWSNLLYYFLLVLLSVGISWLNQKHIILSERNHMPAFFILILLLSFPEVQRLNPALIASVFIVLCADRLLLLVNKENDSLKIFEAAFFLTIGSFVYPPAILLFPSVIIALLIMKSPSWREWLYLLFGSISPALIALTFFLIFDIDYIKLFSKYLDGLLLYSDKLKYLGKAHYFFLSFLGFLVLAAYSKFFTAVSLEKIRVRKILSWFFILLINSILLIFLSPSSSLEAFYIFSIPLSICFSFLFIRMKRVRLANLYLLILLLSILSIRLSMFF